MFIFLPALIGALVGSGVTSFFNLWKFHRDERSSRCDELCKAVTDAASLALDYWSTHYDDNSVSKQIVAETKLRAAQDLFEGIFEDYCVFLSKENEAMLNVAMSEFIDILTGGEFTELHRKPDLARATKSAPAGSRLSVLLRRATRETMPLYRLNLAYHRNKRRVLDMPAEKCGRKWH